MRLVTFAVDSGRLIGVVDEEGRLHDASGVVGATVDMNEVVATAHRGMPELRAAMENGRMPVVEGARVCAPIPRPVRNIFCAGKNYFDHAHEFHNSGFDSGPGEAVPEFPIIFTKATTSVIGPGESIPAGDDPTHSVDYEGELAVVMGAGGRGIPADHALECVFGYMILNDVTSRELQKRHGQWVLGKGMDGFCPTGPWLVTADEVGALEQLTLRTEVNGEIRQNTSVGDMIFNVPTLIAAISERVTLVPGDIIATGTPTGVGIGFKPPKYLAPGDTVTVSIDRLGTLSNPVS